MSHPPRFLENQSKQPCHERPRWVWIAKPINGNYNHYDNFVLGAKKSGSMAHILRNAHWNGENFVPRVFFFFFISGNEWRFVCENKSKVSLLQTSTVLRLLSAIRIAALWFFVLLRDRSMQMTWQIRWYFHWMFIAITTSWAANGRDNWRNWRYVKNHS